MGFQLVIALLFLTAMFFAWAIGGEYRFGKGKRGLLLAIPMSLILIFRFCFSCGPILPLLLKLALQVGFLYCLYQILTYDKSIALWYDEEKISGMIGIYMWGAFIGLTPIFLVPFLWLIPAVLAMSLWFWTIVELSNSTKPACITWRTWLNGFGPQYFPYVDDKGNKGFYINLKDAWYVSSGLMGFGIGVIILCIK